MKHYYSLSLFAILAFLMPSFIFANTDASGIDAKVSISGKVTDALTGEPIQGASLYFADAKTGAVTNSKGEYLIRSISSGSYLLEVSSVGYNSITEHIILNGDLQKDFALSPAVRENEGITVTGVSTATKLKRTPTPVDIISRTELTQATSTNLIDAISKTPGVAQLTTGPSISKPMIRGLGYNRVVILNDGIRQEGQQWGDEHGIEIDEYSVSKVEVLKGPASLIYGSDAMAGVINILTNVPVPEGTIRGNIISNYQTNNHLRGVGANLAGNKNGFNWNVYGSYKGAEDYKNKYDGRVLNSKFNEKNFGGYIGYNGSWGYSHIIVSSFDQKPGLIEGERDEITGQFIKPVEVNGEAEEAIAGKDDFKGTKPGIPYQHIQHFKVALDNRVNIGEGKLDIHIGYQDNKRKEFGDILEPTTPELFFDLNTFTYNLQFHLPDINDWKTTIGVNGMQQSNKNKAEEVLIPEYNLFDAGIFVYAQKNFNRFTLSGGLRLDNRNLNSKAFSENGESKFEGFEKSFSNISGSAGISYEATKTLTLKLNIARGFRAPAIAELASNGTHEGTNRYEYGDNNLKSETSLQFDGSIDFDNEHLSVSATGFLNNINNFIFYRKLESVHGGDSLVNADGEDITAFKFSQAKATLYGVELNVDIHPHPLDWLHFENTFSYVRGVFDQPIEGVRNIPFIPAARLITQLRGEFLKKGKTIRNLALSAELDNTFKQNHAFTTYNTETPTTGYALLNAGISADISGKNKTLFTIILTGNNLTDVAYQNHLSRLKYTAENNATGRMGVFNMGRNFSVKVNIPLQF
ncbi:TonB-dependent receptor [Terrimonas sp.]|uniref:TonB-dependent receptor n=1 Tax=Terrimonas sp. TaxID=1914338 RepID=UPI001F0C627C|nr:TonB-dependent receptor [Terrimonas sp.]